MTANAGNNASPYSETLKNMLQPMVAKCDDGIQQVLSSQVLLAQQIDKVAAELQGFLSSSQMPSFSPHAQRLTDLRKRVNSANATLAQIQDRLRHIEGLAARLESQPS